MVYWLLFRSHKILDKHGIELIETSITSLILLSADSLSRLFSSDHLTLHSEFLLRIKIILSLPLFLLEVRRLFSFKLSSAGDLSLPKYSLE